MTEQEELVERARAELGVKFLMEANTRLGEIADKREQALLVDLSILVDSSWWKAKDYSAFAQLFGDYRECLGILGPAAREIGLKASICARLFENPVLSITSSYTVSFLIDIAKMRPRRSA